MFRLENQNTESVLENKRKSVQEKLSELKSERGKAISQILILQKEIENNAAETEVLENFNKFQDLNSRKAEIIRNAKRNGLDTKDILNDVALQIQKEVFKREKDLQNLKADTENKKTAKEKLKQKVEELKVNMNSYKEDLKSIKNKLMLHYHKILNEGLDTRQEGLVWVIKAIWNLGHNVIMYYMPNYLDEKSIDFLFSIAHKEFALQKLKADIEDFKARLKSRLQMLKNINNSKAKGTSKTFKTDLAVIILS